MLRHTAALASAFAVALAVALAPAAAQQKPKTAPAKAVAKAAATDPQAAKWSHAGKDKLNEWVVGLAAGRTEGAPLRLAAELARVLDDGDRMRVLPIVTRGPFDNMADLLMLRGVDAAVLMGDTLEHFEKVEKVPRLHDRIAYVASLFPSEVHILVRPEINSIADLAGKKVNFNSPGTAAAYTGPLILSKLGIKVTEAFDPHPVALAQMKTSDAYSALFWVTTKPIDPLAKQDFPAGFKLLAVPYTKELEELYMPAALEHRDYPKLIAEGQKVQTVSVPAVLAVHTWPAGTERHKRIARFVDYLFDRLPALQKAPFDPAWKSVSLKATVPGWKRFDHVERRLEEASQKRQAAAPSPKTN